MAPCVTCGSTAIETRQVRVRDDVLLHCICEICLMEWVE